MHAPGDFQVQTARAGDALVVAPQGEIDLATVDVLEDAVAREHDSGQPLVIDLRKVVFMDSTGLRAILGLTERSEAERFAFRIVRGPSAVQRVFEVAGLAPRLPFVDDVGQEPAQP